MSGPKTEFNNQWGRTAADGGDAIPASQTPASGDNQGKEPLTDRFGRFWAVLANPDGPPISVGNVVPVPGATADAADSLQTFKFVGPGIPTADVDTGVGKFYFASGYNATNSDRFLMVFDKAGGANPVNGDVPAYMVPMFNKNQMEPTMINYLNLGVRYANNLKVAISTLPLVLALPGPDDYWINVLYYNQ